jgi:hypothetical protein
MEESINAFRDQHALLLTEIRKLQLETDQAQASRQRELLSILKVVARSYLRENVDPELTEDELSAWLSRLEAA